MSLPTEAPPDDRITVLVTGGAGRLGRHVVAALEPHYAVVNADLDVRGGPGEVRLDVLDLEAVTAVMHGVQAVVHLAALDYDTHAQPHEFMHVNVMGTWNVLQAASTAGVQTVILCSSVAAIGLHEMRRDWAPRTLPVTEEHEARPAEAYGLSKLVLETLGAAVVRSDGLDVMCIRPAAIVFTEHLGDFLRTVDGTSRSLYDYVTAEDVARAIVIALNGSWSGYQCVQLCADDSATADWTPAVYSNARAAHVLGWRPTSVFATLSTVARESSDVQEGQA